MLLLKNRKGIYRFQKILTEKIEEYVKKYDKDCPDGKYPIILIEQEHGDSCLYIKCMRAFYFSNILLNNNRDMLLYGGIINKRHVFVCLDLGYNNITKNAIICADATADWNKKLYEEFKDMERLGNTKEYDEKFEGESFGDIHLSWYWSLTKKENCLTQFIMIKIMILLLPIKL